MNRPFFFVNKIHSCVFCGEKYRYRSNLNKHLSIEHKSPIYKQKKVNKNEQIN
jgi:hypothetical protein